MGIANHYCHGNNYGSKGDIEMTDSEMQKKIAELLGWTNIGVALTYDGLAGLPPGEPAGRTRIPDWLNDIAAAIQLLDKYKDWYVGKYEHGLYWAEIIGFSRTTRSTLSKAICAAFIAAHGGNDDQGQTTAVEG